MSKISKFDSFRKKIGRSVFSDVDNMIDSDSLSNPTLSPQATFEKVRDEALERLVTAIRIAKALIQQYIQENDHQGRIAAEKDLYVFESQKREWEKFVPGHYKNLFLLIHSQPE